MNSERDIEQEIEKLKSEESGLEYEIVEFYEEDVDDNDTKEEIPFNADKIRIDQQMLSLKYIMELMDSGLIDISPDYQRNKVWKDRKKKSLLIESLMLRIPIPAFYFYENEDTKFQVIDGQQRLFTIHEFINNKFKLSGLEYLIDTCKGKYFKDLDIKYQQRIFRTQLAVNILDARSPRGVVYDIFRRVNTGGMKLNPQEMRNAICSQSVRTFLKKSINNENYLKATKGRVKDERMDAQELVLRFYAFYRIYNYKAGKLNFNYSSISQMLDEAIDSLKECSREEFDVLYAKFDEAMRRVYAAFGDYCFIKVTNENGKLSLPPRVYINKSLFTAYSVIIMEEKYEMIDLEYRRDKILKSFLEELQNPEYVNAITIGTSDRRRVKDNFKFSKDVLEKGCFGR